MTKKDRIIKKRLKILRKKLNTAIELKKDYKEILEKSKKLDKYIVLSLKKAQPNFQIEI